MLTAEEILLQCEEFFDQIPNEKNNVKLDQAMDSLRNLIEEQIDGWTNYSEEVLARAIQCRLTEIWGLVSREEKASDPDLIEYYDNLVGDLEEISGYETDEEESFDEEEDES